MTTQNVARRPVAETLSDILASPEVSRLIDELQATRWTGRPGYPLRAMVGMALAKSLYALPTWTRTVALVREHAALAAVIAPNGETPSVYACYRFTAKLREHAPVLERCIADVVRALKKANPLLGWDVAIDASDMPAYAKGMNVDELESEERADPDASWGHRSAISTRKGGGFYGYKLHMAVCSKTDLPLAWRIETARKHETKAVAPLLDKLHTLGIDPETAALDKGYDHAVSYFECAMREIAPVIPLRETQDVKRGEDGPPSCEHGDWTFAGADRKRGASKWRCPTGECQPASVWIKANRLKPLIPRDGERWKGLYRGRGSVERAFGRLKHEWGLGPLRVRRIERVQLHANLTILSQLTSALNRERALALAA
ncbi:MAG TPA: transposase [Solirubrobacteraceae bacterium]|jgi:IS5 family transposase|nr:transposase [Solirubrobacteraceae bacterium]